MHIVAVAVLPGVIPIDLGIACGAFDRVRGAQGEQIYDVRVCGETEETDAIFFHVRTTENLAFLEQADTVIVPGVLDIFGPFPPRLLDSLRTAHARGARVTSICTGAFVLAAAGLLAGRRATTHWAHVADLAQLHPTIDVDPDVLYVDEGQVVTSAGALAGVDMCLHLIRRDHGQMIAADASRLVVAPLNREGGQAQYIRTALPGSSDSLSDLLDWMVENAHEPLDVATLAEKACVSPRTLARRFREQTGTTPLQWLLIARVRRAQAMLETTSNTIETIAFEAGFDSPVTFRTRFQKIVGVSPAAYRRQFAAREPQPA